MPNHRVSSRRRHVVLLTLLCAGLVCGPTFPTPTLAALAKPGPADQALAAQAAEIRQLQRRVAVLTAEVAALRRAASVPSPPRQGNLTVTKRFPAQAGQSVYALLLAGKYIAAIGGAGDRLRLSPNDTEALALQAYALVKIGQPDRARQQVTRALALSGPGTRVHAFALVAQGALADADGKTGAAVTAFRAAGNSDENLALPYIALADHLVKAGKKDNAKAVLQAALQVSMTNTENAAIKQAYARL